MKAICVFPDKIRPEVIKRFSCSTQLSMQFQLLIKGKIMKNKDFFLAVKLKLSDAVFILLINVKIPTIVGIFTLMSRLKNSCSAKLSMEKVYNSA